MPRKFEGNAVKIVRPVRRQDGPLGRMRAAVDALACGPKSVNSKV